MACPVGRLWDAAKEAFLATRPLQVPDCFHTQTRHVTWDVHNISGRDPEQSSRGVEAIVEVTRSLKAAFLTLLPPVFKLLAPSQISPAPVPFTSPKSFDKQPTSRILSKCLWNAGLLLWSRRDRYKQNQQSFPGASIRGVTTKSHCSSSNITTSMEDAHNPDLPLSSEMGFPPPALGKRAHTNGSNANGVGRAGSEPIDASALTQALKDFEDARRTRDRTPTASPSRKRQRIYGDRSVISFSRCAVFAI